MNFMVRAWLYVTRKKGKSALLFVILLIIATFVLTGLSITKATDTAQQQVRESFGAKFVLLADYSSNNPYITRKQTSQGDFIYLNEKPITQEVIDKILSVKGIKSHEIIAGWMPLVQNMELLQGSVQVDENLQRTSPAKASSDSSTSSFFTSGELELVAGRHLKPEDRNAVMISKELAQLNGLKLGDSITVATDAGKNKTTMKIIGLFEPKNKTDDMGKTFTYSKIENMLLSDMASREQFLKGENVGFDQVRFFISDPKQMDDIIEQVKDISSVDWRAYTLAVDNTTFNNAASSLESLEKLISTLLVIIILASAVVLSLILTMWAKSRIHETGVLLACGIGKTKILLQYITEVILIAIFAFGLSCFSGGAIANSVGNSMLQQQVSQNDTVSAEDGNRTGVAVAGVEEPAAAGEEVKSIDVKIGYDDLFRLYLIGFSIIILSVGISSITVMRLKPREILSKMS